MNGSKTEVVFFPDYSANNPYQALLYNSISDTYSANAGSIETALWRQAQAELDETVIFHLHWEDAIYKHVAGGAVAKENAIRSFLEAARSFVARGGIFIWTIHNKKPHDSTDAHLHAEVCSSLKTLADGIHVHSDAAAEEIVAALKIDKSKLYVVPHGNYDPAIGRRVTKDHARRQIDIHPNKRVLIFFGRLSAYKGGAELLEAFRSVEAENAILLICGKQVHPLQQLDSSRRSADTRIRFRDEFLSHEELSLYIAASDFAVLPYRDSLTSGSIVLAFTIGRAVVTPRLAAFRGLVTDRNAIAYDPKDGDGLHRALAKAVSIDKRSVEECGREAQKTAKKRQWSHIRGLIKDMYQDCAAGRHHVDFLNMDRLDRPGS